MATFLGHPVRVKMKRTIDLQQIRVAYLNTRQLVMSLYERRRLAISSRAYCLQPLSCSQDQHWQDQNQDLRFQDQEQQQDRKW